MKFIILISLFISTSVLADFETAMCEKEAEKFGDGTGKDIIPEECAVHFKNQATKKLIKKSNDGSMTVYGYRNIIFINDPKSKIKGQNVIAGSFSGLENIKASSLDEKNDEIVVLEHSGDILFFSSIIAGNVAPKRIIKHKNLEHVEDIAVHGEEVIALDPKNQEVHFFKRTANKDAPEGKKNLSPIRKIKKVKGSELEVDGEKQELAIVDRSSETVSVFGLSGKVKKFLGTKKIAAPKKDQ